MRKSGYFFVLKKKKHLLSEKLIHHGRNSTYVYLYVTDNASSLATIE